MDPAATNLHPVTAPDPRLATSGRSRPWIPALLLLAFVTQSLWFIATQTLTYDEPAHGIAGVEAWQQGRFEHWNDHPPLGRLWLTLPVARTQTDFVWQRLPTGFRVTAMKPGPEWLAWHTRPMNTVLGIALGLALWFAARRLFSEGAAQVALALFVFTPSLIAHFSVATTDGIGTLFIFLVAFQLVRWRRNPTPSQTALMGFVLGGLLLAKFYAPPLVLLALGLMLVLRPGALRKPSEWNWQAPAMALVIALVTLWAGYFFHVSKLAITDGKVAATFPNRAEKIWATKSTARINAFVPAGEFFEGLREVAMSNRRGRAAWFLGQVHPQGGIRLYYPVAIALKWPSVLLLFFFASLAFGLRKACRAPSDLLLMSLFPLLFLAFALQSKYDIGERHILPLYPFALLIAGGVWEHARRSRWGIDLRQREHSRAFRAGPAVIMLALCLNAADALRSAPDYLAYFNIFVNPGQSWRLLTDSNLDWGQGLIAVEAYERAHPGEPIHLAYFGSVDPTLYGVQAPPLVPYQRATGALIVGASCLSGQVLEDSNAYRWLWPVRPVRTLDGSMWVYDVK